MELEMLHKNDSLVVRLYGELDHFASQKIRKEVDGEYRKEISRNILFNMENLSFMDSSGVGVIMGRYKLVASKGGKVAVCGISLSLKKVMEVSGLLKLVEVYENEDEALDRLVINNN